MINTKDVRTAINMLLNSTGIEVNSRDVEEGFKRPSFFVDINSNKRSSSPEHVDRAMTVYIYYFPKDRYEYSLEVLDILGVLENLFDLKLKVKHRLLNIKEFDSSLTDGVLKCWFDLDFSEPREKNILDPDDIEIMQELAMHLDKKEWNE